ncbi:MAG: DoxX family protein [Bacteroidales bacterium]|nr:DoxX family protein [Bacteroidales bacterium]
MNTKLFHYRIRRLCAFIIGLVFLLAGIFKLLDPVGAGLVVEEYYRFLHLGFLMPTAKAVGVLLALSEALLGAALISGIFRKTVAILTSVMIVFFTLVTLLLVIFNPKMECGCFGEVIHLSNLQTFIKNIVLLLLASIAFIPFNDAGECKKRKYISFGTVAVSLLLFTWYSLSYIPLVDYTSFTPGSELYSVKEAAEGGTNEDYMSTFIYEKNGQEGAFTLDKLPDSTWTFVRTETIKINGPEVKDNSPMLSFTDSTGSYMDEMATEGNVLVMSVYDAPSLKGEAWTKLARTVKGADAAGFTPLLLVSGTPSLMDSIKVIIPEARRELMPSTFFSDRRTLLSLNRSNGGATWFNDGELIQKFPLSKLPSDDEILAMTGYDPTETMLRTSSRGGLRFQGFLLYAIALLLLI